MSKYSGANFSVLLVDGYNLAPGIMDNASMGEENLTEQSNPFGVESEAHSPIGLKRGTLVAGGGFYDATIDVINQAIGASIGVSRIICGAIFGNIIGKPFMGFQGAYNQKVEVLDQKDGLTKANVTYLVTGDVDEGQIVQHLTPYTADWDTKTGGTGAPDAPVDYTAYDGNRAVPITSNSVANPTVVTCPVPHGLTTNDKILISGVADSSPTINGERVVTRINDTTFSVPVNVTVGGTGGQFVKADSNAGGVGYIQVSGYSGFTNVVAKIMDSPDDVTYATLITFTTITGITKERLTVAGVVDRYLCSNGVVSGAGSITIFMGFCRN